MECAVFCEFSPSTEDFLAACQPDWRGCLLLDIRMAGMDGLELQQAINLRQIDLPIIFITAHGDVAAARSALKAGASDFLEKPRCHRRCHGEEYATAQRSGGRK